MTIATKPAANDRPTTFILEFRPEPECVDAVRAVRTLLKVAKRRLKLQCISAHESTEAQP